MLRELHVTFEYVILHEKIEFHLWLLLTFLREAVGGDGNNIFQKRIVHSLFLLRISTIFQRKIRILILSWTISCYLKLKLFFKIIKIIICLLINK